ncbi:hypothetical protein CRM22_005806 [Opisthorchis felineus]|uniref:Uncharacterized protein n=1 Tax=Opisthorchis felineus TaxID=147828 RepID=A0A4S2LPD6_OPIFE|nr:hypothetical protein CRM22_005806 [Opisthorchis felineus]
MKTKRNDLRLSRKENPRKSISSVNKPQKRPHNIRPLARGSRQTGLRDPGSSIRAKRAPKSVDLKRALRSTRDAAPTSPVVSEGSGVNPENRRRRINTSEYIKKRFLYDSADSSKKTRGKRRSVVLTHSCVTESHSPTVKLRKAHRITDGTVTGPPVVSQGKRGRREKFNLAHVNLTESVSSLTSASYEGAPLRIHRSKSRKDGHSRQRSTLSDNRSTWELPDVHEVAESTTPEDDRSGHQSHFCLSKSPAAALDELHAQSDVRSQDQLSGFRPGSQSKMHPDGSRHLFSTDGQKRTNILDSHSFFSVGNLSPVSDTHADSLQHFGTDENSERYRHVRYHANLDTEDDDYLHSPLSHDLSEERSQPPNEDVEEEDLLAPELSILTGPDSVAGADGVVLSDTHTLLASVLQPSSGSRRKSPVRPMQVIRTKSSTSVPPMSTFGSNSDTSSIFTPSSNYDRRLSGEDSGRADGILPAIYRQKALIESSQTLVDTSSGLKSASILRMPSNLGTTSIKIRPIRDRAPHDDKDTQNTPAPRAFVNSSPRPSTTASAKPVLQHSAHPSSTGRRRPTILKRGSNSSGGVGGPPFSGQSQLGPELGTEVSHTPVARTVNPFTSGSVHSRRATSLIQSSSARSVVAATSTETGPTKLLQLVTASSLVTPVSPAPLTASDKLFGRRHGAYTTNPLSSTALISAPLSQHTDTDDTRTSTAAPLTPPPYRYAVLRGCPGGKRYLVLGSSGVFDRSVVAPSALSTSPKTTVAECAEEKSADAQDSCQTPSPDAEDNLEDHGLFDPQSVRSIESELTQATEIHIQSTFGAITHPVPSPIVTSVVAT